MSDDDAIYEAIHALRKAHEWLERVDRAKTGYFGLDHALGENDEGCTLCHAVAALDGRVEPLPMEAPDER